MRRNYRGISINTSANTHETVFEIIDDKKDQKIADIPSGSGAFIHRLKDHGYTNVFAMDIENILEIDHANFVEADMTKPLPLEDSLYDVVVCIDGIEHIDQQFDFTREINRILKIGGQFILSTPNISSLRSRMKWLLTGHHHKCNSPLDENDPTPLHHIGMMSLPEIRYMLHTSGFRIAEITTNRIKAVSWLYAILLPLIWLRTKIVYHKRGKKENLTKLNKEVFGQMFNAEVLFGETLIVKAEKRRSVA